MNVMKQIIAGSVLTIVTGTALAHPGHHGDNLLAGMLHSLGGAENIFILLLAGLILAYTGLKSRR